MSPRWVAASRRAREVYSLWRVARWRMSRLNACATGSPPLARWRSDGLVAVGRQLVSVSAGLVAVGARLIGV